MTAEGSVTIRGLSADGSEDTLTVENGQFVLLVADDPVDPSVRHMHYRLPLVSSTTGERFHFDGFKEVRPGVVTQAWPATTTLYVTLRRDGPAGAVVGLGVMRLTWEDFARQLTTIRVTGRLDEVDRLVLLERFGRAFAGDLFHEYGTVVNRSSHLRRNAPPRPHRPLVVCPPEVHPYFTVDGWGLRLTRYNGGDRGPVVLTHGMGANPLTFTIDTIPMNLLEYLYKNGFDVWVQEWRGSTLLPTSLSSFNADDVARYDHPAAEFKVREVTGSDRIHWVTHCVGSMTVTMSAALGVIRPASLLCSQVAANPIGPQLTKLKVDVHAARILRALHVRRLTTDSYDDESMAEKAFDSALRLWPVRPPNNCGQAVCRRLAFIYGVAVHHPAVDEKTHLALHELFGVTNLDMMVHLSDCAGAQQLVDVNGDPDVYMRHLDRLSGIEITLLHGCRNLVWVPESTEVSERLLKNAVSDPSKVRRITYPDHGHQDTIMGASAATDVFPDILDHLVRATASAGGAGSPSTTGPAS